METAAGWERVRLCIETKNFNLTTPMEDERTISTHVLDTSRGIAASNISIKLYHLKDTNCNDWQEIHHGITNADGRAMQLIPYNDFVTGIYKLQFHVQEYFQNQNIESFYPAIEIIVKCTKGQHYHIPILLNPFGYTTYRGT